jgi:hypothetical protein
MNKSIFVATILLLAAASVNAQESEAYNSGLRAGRAFAASSRGIMSSESYKADKKYIVFKLWTEADPITEVERTDLASMRKFLATKNVEIIEYQWKNKQDLDALFKKYGLSVNVISDDHIELKTEHGNYNTTGSKVILVFEDNKPTSLCSGTECEDHLKYFFKLKSVD